MAGQTLVGTRVAGLSHPHHARELDEVTVHFVPPNSGV